eukprot:2356011-Prymnesium_polylepis.2
MQPRVAHARHQRVAVAAGRAHHERKRVLHVPLGVGVDGRRVREVDAHQRARHRVRRLGRRGERLAVARAVEPHDVLRPTAAVVD